MTAGGWRLRLDPSARRTDGGRVLIGGYPLCILRLSGAGARWVDEVAAGAVVPPGGHSTALARRLTDLGMAHPEPPAGGGPAAGDVAAVIPTYGDPEGLARTLASLGPVGDVIVVDDASPDAAGIRQGARGAQVLRSDENRGPAGARELGWRATDLPFVAFVDRNVVLEPGWLQPLLAHFADPSVAAVAPRVRSAAAGAPGWLARYEAARSSLDLGPAPGPVRPGSRVPYVPTTALVVRREAIEAVGGFDVDLRVGEDVDLVWRLHEAGWRVRYEPRAVVWHPARPSVGAWLAQRFAYGTSAAALADRHGDSVAPLGISGWSALAWGAVVAGHPALGAAVGLGTTAALVPKLESLEDPVGEAVRIAGAGNLWAGRSVADALRRVWWPLSLLLGWRAHRTRRALLAALVLPPLLEWREDRPDLDPGRFALLRLVDDVAYGAGVWVGCWRSRSTRALRPRFSGPLDPPRAALDQTVR